MTLTRHASIDTDNGSEPVTYPEPKTLREIACDMATRAHNKGRFDLTPCVTIGDDNIARVTYY